MLREYEHLSYSEIAELMQLPLNTVRSRLFRSRIALKDHLSPSVKTQPAVDKNEGAAHRAVNPVEGEA